MLLFCCFNSNALFEDEKAINAYKENDYAKAKEIYQNEVLNSPNNHIALYNLGTVFYREKDFESAKKMFELASKSEKITQEHKEKKRP